MLSAYYIVNEASGKVLDDPGGSTSNGAVIDQWQLNGGANQQWDFVPSANGNLTMINKASGKALDDPGFSTSNGTPIIQSQLNGGLNQQWQLDVQAGERQLAIVNAYSRMALDDPGCSTSNGTPIDPVAVERRPERAVGAVAGG